MAYIVGATIKALREKKHLTQKELAEKLLVSDKTISKWETDRGLPDIHLLTELADALSVSVAELLTGDIANNKNISANMKRSKFYVCPVCGNVIHALGEGVFSCCGIRLPKLEAEVEDLEHEIIIEDVDDELYVRIDHPMRKDHFISFVALVTDNHIQIEKLYPEQNAELRFRKIRYGVLYILCNRDGLFYKKI